MKEYQERVVEEQATLVEKCEKLLDFVRDEELIKELDPIQQDLLKAQMNSMLTYSQLLNIRIKLFNTVELDNSQLDIQE